MLIAGGALRTMRLVNKATSNYHVDAQHACAARLKSGLEIAQDGFCHEFGTHRLHAIDAASAHGF